MKKIGLITNNKVLAQSLATLIRENPDLEFEPFLFLNLAQAALDAEIHNIAVAVIVVSAGTSKENSVLLSLCVNLREVLPSCKLLLLVPPDNDEARAMAITAIRRKAADDYAFFDTTLDYLFAKLLVL